MPCQSPIQILAGLPCASGVLTRGFGPGALICILMPGTSIWPFGAGVPGVVFGAGVLICRAVPGAQPRSMTGKSIIKKQTNKFFFIFSSYLCIKRNLYINTR